MSRFLPILLQKLDFKSSYETYPLPLDIMNNINELLNRVQILVEEPVIYGQIQFYHWLNSLTDYG